MQYMIYFVLSFSLLKVACTHIIQGFLLDWLDLFTRVCLFVPLLFLSGRYTLLAFPHFHKRFNVSLSLFASSIFFFFVFPLLSFFYFFPTPPSHFFSPLSFVASLLLPLLILLFFFAVFFSFITCITVAETYINLILKEAKFTNFP